MVGLLQLFISLVLLLTLASGSMSFAADRVAVPTPLEFERLNNAGDLNAQVRQFVSNSGPMSSPASKPMTAVKELKIRARMLTPLNSNFNFPGDPVTAQVLASPDGNDKLPAGTLLHGFVESIRPSARLSQDGEITFKFYCAQFGNDTVDLTLAADGESVQQQPGAPPSKKQRLRRLLTVSAKLAIPLAIGTSGTSLAITTGACAVVSAALCDDGHYARAAARGAWEGSGLNVFDPLVQRGHTIVVPDGATVELALTAPAQLPAQWLHTPQSSANRTVLSTSAQLLTDAASNGRGAGDTAKAAVADSNFDVSGALSAVQAFVEQKNMARAMQAMDNMPPGHEDDPAVQAMRQHLHSLITGEPAHD